jgi:hypothetical protein
MDRKVINCLQNLIKKSKCLSVPVLYYNYSRDEIFPDLSGIPDFFCTKNNEIAAFQKEFCENPPQKLRAL